MSEHTKEPWYAMPPVYWLGENTPLYRITCNSQATALFYSEEDRDRTITEHNACLEIPIEALEAGVVKRLVEVAEDTWEKLREAEPVLMYALGDALTGLRVGKALAALKPEGE